MRAAHSRETLCVLSEIALRGGGTKFSGHLFALAVTCSLKGEFGANTPK
jgi:hypothetical protein